MTHLQDQFRSKATPAVVGMNVDLLEMYGVALDHLNVRKTYRNVVGKGDPQMSLAHSLFQHIQARRFVQDGLRRVSHEEPRGCQLNRWQPREIFQAGCP